jgi:threonine/homoserine/homoserine lactone efflux protein
MPELTAIFLPWVIGLISGFLVSVPVGPVNVTIINEGARRGFRWALMIGLGAAAMEVIYCAIGFAGFAAALESRALRTVIGLISFFIMLVLGLRYLTAQSVPAMTRSVERVEDKLHPHSAFMIGFVRVLANPMVLLFWITLAAAFLSHEVVGPDGLSKLIFIGGVGVGASGWFVLLSYVVAQRHQHFTTENLLRMSRISGGCLLLVALLLGTRIIVILVRTME